MSKIKKYTLYIGPTADYFIEHTDDVPNILYKNKREYDENSNLQEPIAEIRESNLTPNLEVFKEISEMILSGDKESMDLAKTWMKEGEHLFLESTELTTDAQD